MEAYKLLDVIITVRVQDFIWYSVLLVTCRFSWFLCDEVEVENEIEIYHLVYDGSPSLTEKTVSRGISFAKQVLWYKRNYYEKHLVTYDEGVLDVYFSQEFSDGSCENGDK
jgi:hypothetical protein